MFDYINVGKKILKSLNNNGYEAYFVGESVRNSLLEKISSKVDITTNASLDEIIKIFNDYTFEKKNEKSIVLHFENHYFYINTFYKLSSNEVLPHDKHYSKNLIEDLYCRDFTINAIAMSHSGKVSDPLNGYSDIVKKKIRHIGKAKIRFKEKPELMVKAFALVSEHNYKLAYKTKTEINRRRKQLLKCEIDLYIDFLKKIFEGPYARKAIKLMNKVNLDMVLPTFKNSLRLLEKYKKPLSFQEVLLVSFLLNGSVEEKYKKYIIDYNEFNKIYNVASQNKKSNFDDITLFNYGLDICLEANKINCILKRSNKKTKKIKKSWNALKIKTTNDLLFNEVDLKRIIQPKDYFIIEDILIDASIAVLSGEINNTFTDVQSVVINLLNQNNIRYRLNGFEDIEEKEENNTDKVTKESDLDIINQYLNKTHQKSYDNDKTFGEDDYDLAYIENNKKIKELIQNDKNFENELKKFMDNYLETNKEGDDE